ncbi:MAG: hypothetical protein ACK50Y_11600, partial [Flavobacteriia bacterium]
MSNLFKIGFNVLKSISVSSKATISSSLNRNLNFEKSSFLVFLFTAGLLHAQTTLYSEDFQDPVINHKGFYESSTLNLTGVSNWTIQGSPDAGGYSTGDWFAVVNNRFESMDTDPFGTTIDWVSKQIDIVNYSGVSISVEIAAVGSYSLSGVIAWYELNNSGVWIQFGKIDNTTKTASNSGTWSGNVLS